MLACTDARAMSTWRRHWRNRADETRPHRSGTPNKRPRPAESTKPPNFSIAETPSNISRHITLSILVLLKRHRFATLKNDLCDPLGEESTGQRRGCLGWCSGRLLPASPRWRSLGLWRSDRLPAKWHDCAGRRADGLRDLFPQVVVQHLIRTLVELLQKASTRTCTEEVNIQGSQT